MCDMHRVLLQLMKAETAPHMPRRATAIVGSSSCQSYAQHSLLCPSFGAIGANILEIDRLTLCICCVQVGSLQERIDELAEELEEARAAASAAAAALAPTPSTTATAADSAHTQPAAGRCAGAAAAAAGRRSSGGPGSPGTQLSRESSSSKVPLMGDDTPLAELHAQVRPLPDRFMVCCQQCLGCRTVTMNCW
jgi:hypothetical protein